MWGRTWSCGTSSCARLLCALGAAGRQVVADQIRLQRWTKDRLAMNVCDLNAWIDVWLAAAGVVNGAVAGLHFPVLPALIAQCVPYTRRSAKFSRQCRRAKAAGRTRHRRSQRCRHTPALAAAGKRRCSCLCMLALTVRLLWAAVGDWLPRCCCTCNLAARASTWAWHRAHGC